MARILSVYPEFSLINAVHRRPASYRYVEWTEKQKIKNISINYLELNTTTTLTRHGCYVGQISESINVYSDLYGMDQIDISIVNILRTIQNNIMFGKTIHFTEELQPPANSIINIDNQKIDRLSFYDLLYNIYKDNRTEPGNFRLFMPRYIAANILEDVIHGYNILYKSPMGILEIDIIDDGNNIFMYQSNSANLTLWQYGPMVQSPTRHNTCHIGIQVIVTIEDWSKVLIVKNIG